MRGQRRARCAWSAQRETAMRDDEKRAGHRCARPTRHVSLALSLLTMLAIFSSCASAWAVEGYGELSHFGSPGTSHGQFRLTGATINGTDGTRAFGVTGSENAVFVGDEPKAKEYRIQELTSTGAFVAATAGFKPPNRQGLEGIAFDPSLKRLYVLALERRGVLEIDSQKSAAGSLYAFSTDAEGEVLPPASGTVEGVLTGPTTFKSESNVLGDALLKPKGIAVDPTNHDIIVTGELDEEGDLKPFALQRIDSASGQLGARYVDRSGLLTLDADANSPVVSPGGAVYVESLSEETGGQLTRIPSDFTSLQPPTPFIDLLPLGPLESEANPVVVFANGSGAESLEGGGGLSLSPEAGGNARIYTQARIWESDGAGGGAPYIGALAFEDVGDSEGFELGWSGGQSRQTTESCAIGTGGPTAPMIAAGSAETVFILDPKFAHVDEFGPGGSGCPTALAGEIVATVNGTPLSGTIQGGTEVALTTSLTRANALSVEWSFDEGEAKPLLVSSDEYQNTRIAHKFEKGGELTVTETIHTDNLATPTLVRTIKIPVSVSHILPNAVLTGPLIVGVNEAATFDGSASWDPNGAPGSSPIDSYHWDFGDGESATSEKPEIEHTYKETGLYVAKLVVVDGYGLESAPIEIDITVDIPPPPAPVTPVGLPEGPTGAPPPILATEQAPPPSTSGPPPAPSLVPAVRLLASSLNVTPNGAVAAVLACPAGESACDGTVTLRTLGAVLTTRGVARSKKVVLTLARGLFSIAGGRRESLSLRLSTAGRRLLARAGTLRARATVVAHDTAGATHTTTGAVTLRAARTGRPRK
jgi:hypothetical protein